MRAAATLRSTFSGWLDALFAPTALPTSLPRLVLFVLLVGVAALARQRRWPIAARARATPARAARCCVAAARLAAVVARTVVERTLAELWNLIRGAAPIAAPPPAELGRRYVELLADNLGQPGFRELLVTVHDVDAHRDWCSRCSASAHRPRFFGGRRAAESAARAPRRSIWPASARDHASMRSPRRWRMPVATEPHLTTFSPKDCWRGETHRLCDRAGGARRLLDELVAAGAEQVILVVRRAPPGRATSSQRRRASTSAAAPASSSQSSEAAGLRDALRAIRRPVCRAVRRSGRRTTRSGRSISPAATTSDRDRTPGARRADRPRLRGRLPPVHRAGGRRQRRADRSPSGNVRKSERLESCQSAKVLN